MLAFVNAHHGAFVAALTAALAVVAALLTLRYAGGVGPALMIAAAVVAVVYALHAARRAAGRRAAVLASMAVLAVLGVSALVYLSSRRRVAAAAAPPAYRGRVIVDRAGAQLFPPPSWNRGP